MLVLLPVSSEKQSRSQGMRFLTINTRRHGITKLRPSRVLNSVTSSHLPQPCPELFGTVEMHDIFKILSSRPAERR